MTLRMEMTPKAPGRKPAPGVELTSQERREANWNKLGLAMIAVMLVFVVFAAAGGLSYL